MTADQHQPGQATASQAWAAYMAKQAEADTAREISTDLGTDEGVHAYLLVQEAEAAYDEYADAWGRENHAQVEASDPEPEM
jgi:hypothetical protein